MVLEKQTNRANDPEDLSGRSLTERRSHSRRGHDLSGLPLGPRGRSLPYGAFRHFHSPLQLQTRPLTIPQNNFALQIRRARTLFPQFFCPPLCGRSDIEVTQRHQAFQRRCD